MQLALLINVAMLVAAVVGGLLTGSLALLADAGHVLSDVGAIALGLAAAALASRSGGPRSTFGLQRSEVLAALVNGLALVAIAVLVAVAAIGRLSDPPDVEGAGVLALGLFGLAGNAAATWVLARGDRADVNLEGVLRHSLADALGSLAVVASGAIVLATGWLEADPIASLVVAGADPASPRCASCCEPLGVLMEAAPAELDVEQLGRALLEVRRRPRGARAARLDRDDRVRRALRARRDGRGRDRDLARRELEYLLRERYGIAHTTLQMEEEAEEGALLQVGQPDA